MQDLELAVQDVPANEGILRTRHYEYRDTTKQRRRERMTTPNVPPILTAAVLAEAGFSHGFTTRIGGVSPPPHGALDLATARDPDALRENQRRVAAAVGFDPDRLRQVTQVHGARAVVATDDAAALLRTEADALVAAAGSGFAVGVRVADCVPVLAADRDSGRVAAIHAGWRGVEAGIVAAALAELRGSSLACAIGPSIGPCCFEVGADVAERINRAAGDDVVVRRDADKAYVDLRRAVRLQLRAHGVADASIEDVAGCTRCDAERFHSYRRDGDRSGRSMGVIVAR